MSSSSSSSIKRNKSLSEEPKSKRTRHEFIRSAVSSYMKDKRYASYKKIRRPDCSASQANKQFFFNKMVKDDAFLNNFFLFTTVTCNSSNYKIINEEFNKFTSFVENQKMDIKVQLRKFYGPIICHLYLEILKGKEPTQANDFLRANAHHVPSERDSLARSNKTTSTDPEDSCNVRIRYFMNLVKLLLTCSTLDAAESIQEVVSFRSSKFEIDVNIDAIQVLNEFLRNHANVLLLSTIHTWLHINVTDVKDHKSENSVVIKEKEKRQITDMKPPLPVKGLKTEQLDLSTTQQSNIFQVALANIDHIIQEMKNTYQDYPQYVKVFDSEKFLTSAHYDTNQCHVAAGFDDSVVKLWQHSSQMLRGKNIYTSYRESICPWHVNNRFTEEEEDDDLILEKEEEEFPMGMNNQAVSGEILLRGHSRGVTDLRFSSYFPILLTVSKDESMRCWSANSYRCSRVYNGHNSAIWCVNESPLGSYVATGSKDLTARLWSLDREFPLITYIGHTQDVNCLAFHPNGSYLATGADDFSVRLWSVATGKVFRVFSESKQPISTLAFSPDGKYLAAAGEEKKIRILDLAAGQQLCELKEHTASVTSISWNTSGDKIASGSSDGVLKIWNISKLEASRSSTAEGTSNGNTSSLGSTSPVTFSNNNLSRVCKVEYNSNDVLTCIGRK